MGSSLLRCCQHSEVRIATRQSFLLLTTGFDWLEIATPSHAVGADAPAECLAIAAHPNGGHKNVLHWNLPFGWPWARVQDLPKTRWQSKKPWFVGLWVLWEKALQAPSLLSSVQRIPFFLISYHLIHHVHLWDKNMGLWNYGSPYHTSLGVGNFKSRYLIKIRPNMAQVSNSNMSKCGWWELQMHLIVSSKISAKLKLPPTT